MALSAGTKLGPYEIGAPLGAGGMGEVYRARDTRLGRDVAVKILPSQFSNDPTLKQRFEREAKTISQLSHPHICVLHDIGSQDGVDYLVMELVDGETLAQRLDRGPLPLDQVLKIGAQIADALDKAHRNGVVHRDLKPGNLMLTRSGAKLLDFGLAKPPVSQAVGMTLTADMTQVAPVTQAGTIVGTFQYMSPEQIEGKEVDGRSDIFALGAVLYEMLTGKRAFQGKSQLSVASAILEKDPEPISTTKPLTPPALDHAIRMCLAKSPEDRWQTASDLKSELNWIAETGAPPEQAAAPRSNRSALITALACVAVAAAAGAAAWFLKPAPVSNQMMRLAVPLPDTMSLPGFAKLSPDGRRLVLGERVGNLSSLAVRSLDSSDVQPLPGTDNSRSPFWSADSRSIAFYAEGKLKTISANGGPPQVLCDAGSGGFGGAWNSDGVILYTADTGPLLRTSASGGTCAPLMNVESGQTEESPVFLPDGKHFLYHLTGGDESKSGIYLASLDVPTGQRLLADNSSVAFAPSTHGRHLGYVLFRRGSALMAQPLDTGTLQLAGDAFTVAQNVALDFSNLVAVSASDNGTLEYLSDLSRDAQLTWLDRSGKELAKVGPHGPQSSVSLSPDNKLAAVGRNLTGTDVELWLENLVRGGETPLTFNPTHGRGAIWSPDSTQVILATTDGRLYRKDANAAAQEEQLLAGGDPKYPSDWSRDGRFLLYTDIDPNTGPDIWVLPDPSGKSGDAKPFPFLQTQFMESQAQFSPDGHWIAYISNESGQGEIYVRAFSGKTSGSGAEWKISTEGGREPRWSPDGRDLYYLALSPTGHFKNQLMDVPVHASGADFQAGTPKMLFEFFGAGIVPQRNLFGYSVAADGQRFLVNVALGEINTTVNVIVNWEAGVPRNK
jgi:eukaryotic-like serine/threonine-protein kinase